MSLIHSLKIENCKLKIIIPLVILLPILILPRFALAGVILKAPPYIGLQEGLVGYWSFNGPDMSGNTATDRSGNANNGTLTNGPKRAAGKLGQTLEFDGSDDYISSGTAGLLSANGSVAFWVKSTADTGPDTSFSVGRTAAASSFAILIGDGSTAFLDNELITIATDDQATLNRVGYTTTNRSELFDGNWHHVVVVAASSYSIYIDGQSKSITVGNGFNNGQFTDIAGLDVTRVGNTNQGGTNQWYMQGSLDEVRIYNRALSADEIKRLYNMGR